MENERQAILNRLNTLNNVRFSQPTARDLRCNRPLLQRVQRRNIDVYKKEVESQKGYLNAKLSEVDNYLESLRRNEAESNNIVDGVFGIRTNVVSSVIPTPAPIPAPTVIISSMPVRMETRLRRFDRRFR